MSVVITENETWSSHEQKTLRTHFLPESLGRLMALATVESGGKEREQFEEKKKRGKILLVNCKN